MPYSVFDPIEITMSEKGKAIFVSSGGNYVVSGKVVNSATGEGLEGFRVEAWDKDLIGKDDRLGEALTQVGGEFSVTFNAKAFREFIFDKKPDLYFNIYDEEEKIFDTKKSPLKNADENTPEISISVDVVSRIKKGFHGPVLSTPIDFLTLPSEAPGGGNLPWFITEGAPEAESFNVFFENS